MTTEQAEVTPMPPVEVIVTKRNFSDLITAGQKRVGTPKSVRWWGMAIMALLSALFLIWIRFVERYGPQGSGQMDGVDVALASVMVGMLMTVGCGAFLSAIYRKGYVERFLREGGAFLGPRTLTIAPDGVVIEGANGRSLTTWPTILDVSEFGKTTFLWTDPAGAVIVPNNGFEDDAARLKFIEEIRRRLTPVRQPGISHQPAAPA